MITFAPEERAELLRIAAAVLASRMPAWSAAFRCDVRGELPRTGPLRCRARWAWPGVLTVFDEDTGEPLARSLPGRPATPDARTRAGTLRGELR